MAQAVGAISGFMYGKLLIVMLLGVGFFWTFRTKFVQFRFLGESIRLCGEKSKEKGAVSSFGALMVSTASRVGTGNIVGVAGAILIGGYGAVFWMWLIAIIGGASAFVESTLAQIFKKKDSDGSCYGGPSYYIEKLTGNRAVGVIFAASLIATYVGGFNMLCSYNLQSTFKEYSFYTANSPLFIGGIVAAITLWCLLGGGKRVVKVAGVLVPFMGILYVGLSLVVILMHISAIPSVMKTIFCEAFNFKAIFGAGASSAVMQGIKRGLYSNEAGVGSAPNAAATADVSHPVKQGLVQMLSVFIDTLILCTATACMIMSTGLDRTKFSENATFIQETLAANFGAAGPIFITAAMCLFAFTTLIGNYYYCEGCLKYVLNRAAKKGEVLAFRIASAVLIFAGASLEIGLAWDLADVLMGIMAIINLPSICLLGRFAVAALKDYEAQRKAGKDPSFAALSIGIDGTDFWK